MFLRLFEQVFLQELGYAIDFSQDANGQGIAPTVYYQFIPQEGFVIGQYGQNFLGQDLLNLVQIEQINSENVSLLAKLYRLILTELLGNKPLKSRQLWVSQLHQS